MMICWDGSQKTPQVEIKYFNLWTENKTKTKETHKTKLSLCDIFSSKLDLELVFYSPTTEKRNIRQLTLNYDSNCI